MVDAPIQKTLSEDMLENSAGRVPLIALPPVHTTLGDTFHSSSNIGEMGGFT